MKQKKSNMRSEGTEEFNSLVLLRLTIAVTGMVQLWARVLQTLHDRLL